MGEVTEDTSLGRSPEWQIWKSPLGVHSSEPHIPVYADIYMIAKKGTDNLEDEEGTETCSPISLQP